MANTAVQQPEKKGFSLTLANPVIRKLEKNGEFGADQTATYGGIVGKTVFFLIVTVIGVLLCFILHNILTGSGAANLIHVEDTKNGIYDLTMSVGEAVIAGVALLVSLITPFLAWFIRPTIPVTGT